MRQDDDDLALFNIFCFRDISSTAQLTRNGETFLNIRFLCVTQELLCENSQPFPSY